MLLGIPRHKWKNGVEVYVYLRDVICKDLE
jgi:hypothetical protein